MDITVMRSAGLLYQQQKGGYISNVYNAEIINKTDKKHSITIRPDDRSIKIKYIQAPGAIGSGMEAKAVFFMMIPQANIHTPKTDVRLQLWMDDHLVETVNTAFIGPIN